MPSVSTFAVGKRGYTYGAANLAATIKLHSPGVDVKLYTDGASLKYLKQHHLDAFDRIVILREEDYTTSGALDPGKMKTRVADLVEDVETLFVDADSIATSDIRAELRSLQDDGRDFICQTIAGYLPWASEGSIRLKVGNDCAPIYGVQSSWFFVRRGLISAKVREVFDSGTWQTHELQNKWGHSLPDELCYTHACAVMEHDPTGPELMLFGNKVDTTGLSETCSKYRFLTLYGNGGGKPHVRGIYIDMYDVLCMRAYNAKRENHTFKHNYILADKYLTK